MIVFSINQILEARTDDIEEYHSTIDATKSRGFVKFRAILAEKWKQPGFAYDDPFKKDLGVQDHLDLGGGIDGRGGSRTAPARSFEL